MNFSFKILKAVSHGRIVMKEKILQSAALSADLL